MNSIHDRNIPWFFRQIVFYCAGIMLLVNSTGCSQAEARVQEKDSRLSPTKIAPTQTGIILEEIVITPTTTPSPTPILRRLPSHTPETPPAALTPTPLPASTTRVDVIAVMWNRFAQYDENIPREIWYGNVSMEPYYPSDSPIRQLQLQLSQVPVGQKGEIVASIIGFLGVQTKEERQAQRSNLGRVPRWNVFDENRRRILTCNTYATTLMRALGIKDISHWYGPGGVPWTNEGTEYQARDMREWLVEYGADYGWTDISRLSLERKLEYLADGYILYGARGTHNWVIFGYLHEGEVFPVMTQSTPNTLFARPAAGMFDLTGPGTLFAHRLP